MPKDDYLLEEITTDNAEDHQEGDLDEVMLSSNTGTKKSSNIGKKIRPFSLDEFVSGRRIILLRAALGELLCTTLFIFMICAVGINTDRSAHRETEGLTVSALTTAFCSIALIYSFADVSGAHFNPAVTIATLSNNYF
jgi:hypothetical protein